MIKCIHISFGYVESSQMVGPNFTCKSGFQTPGEALVSLANGLYHRYTEAETSSRKRKKSAPKQCCQKAVGKKFDFCPKCGSSLRKQDFDVQEYADWLRHLATQTADSWGGGDIVASEGDAWNPWNSLTSLLRFSQEEVLDIRECGEAVLLRATTALQEDYPDQDLEAEFDELGYLPEDYKELLPATVSEDDFPS
jgi:hypothetical protein